MLHNMKKFIILSTTHGLITYNKNNYNHYEMGILDEKRCKIIMYNCIIT